MRKRIISLALTGLGIAGMIFPASASADRVDDYLVDVGGTMEVDTYEAEAVAIGLGICVDLLTGSTVRDEFGELMSSGASPQQAQALIDAAVSWLCPSSVGRTLR